MSVCRARIDTIVDYAVTPRREPTARDGPSICTAGQSRRHLMSLIDADRSYGRSVASEIEDARRAIGRAMLAGDGGSAALHRYTEQVDRELQRLDDAAGGSAQRAPVVALGGDGPRPPRAPPHPALPG